MKKQQIISILIAPLLFVGCNSKQKETPIAKQKEKKEFNSYGIQPLAHPKDDIQKKETSIAQVPSQKNVQFKIPKEFLVKAQKFSINPKRDTILKIGDNGTQLIIPKESFKQNGATVTENVSIQFKEYKNSADMAFSQIPMTYSENGEEYNFNSSGMFEISGYSNNKKVQIAPNKNVKIDYALAKQNPDISFFKLNEESKEWKDIQEIRPKKQRSDAKFNTVTEPMMELEQGNGKQWIQPDNGNRSAGTLISGADPGHTFPNVIRGLNINSFGVYNCDQIYRLPNRVNISAKYNDENGKEITDLHVLSLIDLKYNGAFSFNPRNFTCDAKGKNVLALFTKSGKIYLLNSEEFQAMEISKNGKYNFSMTDMTAEIENTSDLKAYLEL